MWKHLKFQITREDLIYYNYFNNLLIHDAPELPSSYYITRSTFLIILSYIFVCTSRCILTWLQFVFKTIYPLLNNMYLCVWCMYVFIYNLFYLVIPFYVYLYLVLFSENYYWFPYVRLSVSRNFASLIKTSSC